MLISGTEALADCAVGYPARPPLASACKFPSLVPTAIARRSCVAIGRCPLAAPGAPAALRVCCSTVLLVPATTMLIIHIWRMMSSQIWLVGDKYFFTRHVCSIERGVRLFGLGGETFNQSTGK